MGCDSGVVIHQIYSTEYSIEVEFESTDTNGKLWAIFVYASTREKVREDQWHALWDRSRRWRDRWTSDIRGKKMVTGLDRRQVVKGSESSSCI